MVQNQVVQIQYLVVHHQYQVVQIQYFVVHHQYQVVQIWMPGNCAVVTAPPLLFDDSSTDSRTWANDCLSFEQLKTGFVARSPLIFVKVLNN